MKGRSSMRGSGGVQGRWGGGMTDTAQIDADPEAAFGHFCRQRGDLRLPSFS